MIDGTEFDTIYHEHLCYFSLTALDRLFGRHGLVIQDAERLPIHGGTLRIYAVKANAATAGSPSPAVVRLLDQEKNSGVPEFEYYRGFAENVERLRNDLVTLLRNLKAREKRIAVYRCSSSSK